MMEMGGQKKNGRKIAAAIAGGSAVFLVLYAIAVNLLVNAALVPSFMERLEAFERITDESYAAQVQTTDIKENGRSAWVQTKEWLKTAERRKLSVQSEDGYNLVAEVFPMGTDSHRWALLLHGYTGWKEELYPFAYWYHGEGYHVLAPDLRCQGESEGDFIGMGWTDHFDCMLWIQYILSQDGEAEIVLHGQSMGAATALMMAGDEALPGNVKAVVSDCSYTDAYAMFSQKIGEWFGLPAFPFVDSACLALKLRGGYDLKDASALEAVRRSKTPTLFIHGGQDAMISVDMAKELYDAAAGQKELLIVEDAGHAQSQDKDPGTYYGTIQAFLEKSLAK
ncbi:MAG: alpha/beta hydrolase [Lachnospiraceae bacterium]|nr:alpha/beta hydrolase [Lachnospiraceae bacterium]